MAKHITGLASWLQLTPGILDASEHRFPPAFAWFFLKSLGRAKLTVHAGRTYLQANYPALNTRAWRVAAESLSRISRGEQRLLTICISPTMRCPMNCFYCSGRNYPTGRELGTERLKLLVKEAQDLGVFAVDFSGGEPLLRDDLPEIVAAVDDRSVSLLFTSGFRFGRMSRALHQAGLEQVVLGLDTMDEAEQNRRRGNKNAFGVAMEAIRTSLAEGFYTSIEMTMDPSMLTPGVFAKFLRSVGRLGVHEVRTLAPRACVALGGERSPCFTNAQVEVLRRHQAQYNRDPRLPTVTSIDDIEAADNQGCFGGSGFCHVTADGDVTPCPFHPISFGNVAEQSLAQVYANMRRFIQWPPATCPLTEIFRLIGPRPPEAFPIRDIPTIERIYAELARMKEPIPGFWRRLGVRRK